VQSDNSNPVELLIDERIVECNYGDWTGRQLKKLSKEPLWKQVQGHPSAVTFPGGESMRAMQQRAVEAVRYWNMEFGDKAVYALISHGDVIKAVVADALGMHLDQFQRISVDPGSMCIIEYTPLRPFVVRTNDTGSDLSFMHPQKKKKKARSSDAAVGGGGGR
jgi:probable phosphoglycerate mutase